MMSNELVLMEIREIQQKDANAVSALVKITLRESLLNHYPNSTIERLCADYEPIYFKKPFWKQKSRDMKRCTLDADFIAVRVKSRAAF